MKESEYQSLLIKKIKNLFKGCVILKNDAQYKQGIPDLTIFFEDKWAMLEVKINENFKSQPNQKMWVERMDGMSYAAFIYPENEEQVLNELQHAFSTGR